MHKRIMHAKGPTPPTWTSDSVTKTPAPAPDNQARSHDDQDDPTGPQVLLVSIDQYRTY